MQNVIIGETAEEDAVPEETELITVVVSVFVDAGGVPDAALMDTIWRALINVVTVDDADIAAASSLGWRLYGSRLRESPTRASLQQSSRG